MGTHVFFEKDEAMPVDELYCKCESYYKFQAKTNKVLKMSRVLIKDNAIDSEVVQKKDLSGIKEQLRVTRSYEEALSLFLVDDRSPPRRIPRDENTCEGLQSPRRIKQEFDESTAFGEVKGNNK